MAFNETFIGDRLDKPSCSERQGDQLKVYINGKGGERKLVDADLLKENKSTIIVKLPDGNIISRKKKRDLPEEKG